MRRIVLAVLAAVLVLATSDGAAAADSKQIGEGTIVRTQTSKTEVLGTVGSLNVLRWTEVIDFEGTLDGESACTVYALQSSTSLSLIGWCRYTGSVGDSDPGTASGPSAGRFTFVPTFGGSIVFSLRGGTGELEGLRLTGTVDPLTGNYSVTY